MHKETGERGVVQKFHLDQNIFEQDITGMLRAMRLTRPNPDNLLYLYLKLCIQQFKNTLNFKINKQE